MIRKCSVSGEKFKITKSDLEFYEKMSVSAPTLCPDERLRRRLSWRNERKLYKRKCSATGKNIISIHHAEKTFPVYENRYWWSDEWSPLDFGREFDFSRSFFSQFNDLMQVVPQIAIMNDDGISSENCAYCQDFSFGKDCYLSMGMWQSKNCYYVNLCDYGDDLVDCSSVYKSELSYECMCSRNLYRCGWLETSRNCSDCWFGKDLVGCKDCFGCSSLTQAQYYIFNKPYSKEKYYETLKTMNMGAYKYVEFAKKQWQKLSLDFPRQAVHQVQCETCSGDMLYNCKNMFDSHRVYNAENCKYFIQGDSPKNCYDVYNSGKCQWCLESITPDHSWMSAYTLWCWECKQVYYSDNCHNSENLFGCISLKRAKHCILNKSYTKHEYQTLREKIVGHMKETGEWGEFFPIEMSPFAYNETVAQEYFPLTKEEALKRDYGWREGTTDQPNNGLTDQFKIPDDIKNVEDNILKQTLYCEVTGKGYRIQKSELDFYRKMDLPIPRLHPDERHKQRMSLRNPRKLWERACADCQKSIQTAYEPSRPEKVLCEECYLKAVK
jgi:hypothetical protein